MNSPSIAVAVDFVQPVSALVLQHEAVVGLITVEDFGASLAEAQHTQQCIFSQH